MFAWRNVIRIKNYIEKHPQKCSRAIFADQKKFEMYLRPLFNVFFYADSESVFNFFLSCLELEKLELKIYEIMHHVVVYSE